MMWNIDNIWFGCILGILFVTEMLKFKYVLGEFFGFRVQSFWKITGGLALLLIFCSRMKFIRDTYRVLIIFSVAIVFFVICKEEWKKKLLYIPLFFFVISFMDEMIEIIMDIVVGENSIFTQLPYSYLICNIVGLFGLVSLWAIKRKRLVVKSKIVKIVVWCMVLFISASIPLTIASMQYARERIPSEKFAKGAEILSFFSFASLIMIILAVIYIYDTNTKMKKYLELEVALKETQKKYYEALLKKEEKTKQYRHDMINQLVCLKGMAQNRENEKVVEYINQICGQFDGIRNVHYSVGNEVIDVLLNHWLPTLRETKIEVKGVCSEKIDVNYLELCTVFSNLLQNAVEELEQFINSEKVLKIFVKQKKENVIIEIINSSKEKQFYKKTHLPKTTKKDKINHGIGLMNVKETVEKHRGIFECSWEKGEFKTKVILPLKIK